MFFQPSHLETKLLLKHELNWFAVCSVLYPFAPLYSTVCISVKLTHKGALPTALRYYSSSGFTLCYGSETCVGTMTSEESK